MSETQEQMKWIEFGQRGSQAASGRIMFDRQLKSRGSRVVPDSSATPPAHRDWEVNKAPKNRVDQSLSGSSTQHCCERPASDSDRNRFTACRTVVQTRVGRVFLGLVTDPFSLFGLRNIEC
jgi:hypothetical protein